MNKHISEFIKEEQEYIEDIRSKIDFEHSIAIHYPTSGGMKSVYIVEFKTDDQNRKTFFAFNPVDADFALHKNFYVAAIYTHDILNKIPVWQCEVSQYDLSQLDLYRYGVEETLNRVRCAQRRQQMACPETGSFTAYKQVFGNDHNAYICELLIPEDAQRSSGFDRKCRADKAKVIAIWALEYVDTHRILHFTKTRKRVARSIYDKGFIYRVGETVTPTNGFDTDRFNTCAPGIHFYMTMAEAAPN